MAEVTLTAALRTNLLSLQRTQGLLDITQNRLATGRKVNSALDNANAFFASQSLNNRATDLERLLDGIGQGVQTLKAADQGITSLTKLVEQAQSIAQTARDIAGGVAEPVDSTALTAEETAALTTAKEELDKLAEDFNAIMVQIDQLARDSGYRGTNLLGEATLTIQFNENDTSQLVVTGVDFSSEGLEFTDQRDGDDVASYAFFVGTAGDITSAAIADYDQEATLTNIEAALDEAKGALESLRNQARTFGGNLATIQVREEFTKGLINTLKEGADKLTLADINEEGAKLLSLQTAQQLGITSLALASQAQQSVLRLF
jgi:flagellin